MSRRDEVEASIIGADGAYHERAWLGPESLRHLARTLAAEVDELTARRMETIAMIDLLAAELAAANATLAALRLVVPPHGYWPLDDTEHDNITAKIHAILYPEGRDND